METKNQELFLSLSQEEMLEVNGGELPKWVKGLTKHFTAVWVFTEVISNWDEIKQGLKDGWAAGGN